MEKDGTLKILNYYLEYEIYNLANSTQIKTDMNNCYIIKEKIDVSKVTKSLFDIDYADFFNIEKNFEFSYK